MRLIALSFLLFVLFKLTFEIDVKDRQLERITYMHFQLSEQMEELQIDTRQHNKLDQELKECTWLLQSKK